ncbi:methionyl-tRNA formyltransferase [Patescibacteria group bacterium]|nr:methionyl-tRNA formyltransferase [Patescibacteria group bacterium]
MTVIFFGSSDYCLPVLEALKNYFDLELVVTREDKPVGRKQIVTASPTKTWAIKNNIRAGEELDIDCDLAIVADYGKIIPEEIFTRPRLGTFNIHFSRLPDLRGASPVQATLLRGDTTAWIKIPTWNKTLDTGPILWQKEYPIAPDDTAGTLYTRLFQEVARELPKIDFFGPLTPQSSPPTYCKTLTRNDGFIKYEDLTNQQNYNKYRAYFPWPGVWSIKNGKRMKILKCHLEDNKLILDLIQFEGKKPTLYH